jgi:hypothetical protein
LAHGWYCCILQRWARYSICGEIVIIGTLFYISIIATTYQLTSDCCRCGNNYKARISGWFSSEFILSWRHKSCKPFSKILVCTIDLMFRWVKKPLDLHFMQFVFAKWQANFGFQSHHLSFIAPFVNIFHRARPRIARRIYWQKRRLYIPNKSGEFKSTCFHMQSGTRRTQFGADPISKNTSFIAFHRVSEEINFWANTRVGGMLRLDAKRFPPRERNDKLANKLTFKSFQVRIFH